MPRKLAKTKKPKTRYQKKLNILITEGIKRQAERDDAVQKLSMLETAYDSSKAVWNRQEERMLNQITQLNQRLDFMEQEKSNLLEVITNLGEILGHNKSEIQNLKLFRQKENNFLIASTPKNETERR